jgi:secondary thiamine-phosphate synthase enzyme
MRATELGLRTDAREDLVDLTSSLRDRLAEQGWREGLLHVRAPHTTAGVCINENADPDVAADILDRLGQLVPVDGPYRHD